MWYSTFSSARGFAFGIAHCLSLEPRRMGRGEDAINCQRSRSAVMGVLTVRIPMGWFWRVICIYRQAVETMA